MVDTQRIFCVFGHKSPSVPIQPSDLQYGNGMTDITNQEVNGAHSAAAPDFLKLTPRTSELNAKKLRLTELDESVQSMEDLEYDMNPASSF